MSNQELWGKEVNGMTPLAYVESGAMGEEGAALEVGEVIKVMKGLRVNFRINPVTETELNRMAEVTKAPRSVLLRAALHELSKRDDRSLLSAVASVSIDALVAEKEAALSAYVQGEMDFKTYDSITNGEN